MHSFPVGTILPWTGSIASIPAQWSLCDGTNGTPDLTDRFVQGAGGALTPGDTGGGSNHDHTFTGDGHNHTIPLIVQIGSGASHNATTANAATTGTTDPTSSLPKYYALAMIMLTG